MLTEFAASLLRSSASHDYSEIIVFLRFATVQKFGVSIKKYIFLRN